MALLEVVDHGELITFSFEDLLRYHGRSAIGGVAHGFKVMERALPLLAAGQPPERYDISVETAFEGGGARDAIEMVTRAVTGGRFAHRQGAVVDLTLRPGLVREELQDDAASGRH